MSVGKRVCVGVLKGVEGLLGCGCRVDRVICMR